MGNGVVFGIYQILFSNNHACFMSHTEKNLKNTKIIPLYLFLIKKVILFSNSKESETDKILFSNIFYLKQFISKKMEAEVENP